MKVFTQKKATTSTNDERLINAMSILGDSTRFKMFNILLSGQEMCVSEIADKIGVSVPATSQHFRLFELSNMVYKVRYGQKICYKLKTTDDVVKRMISIINK